MKKQKQIQVVWKKYDWNKKRKISIKAVRKAIASKKTPEPLRKGLIKKYRQQLKSKNNLLNIKEPLIDEEERGHPFP